MPGSQRRSEGPILPMHNGSTRRSADYRDGSARRHQRRAEPEKETMGHKIKGHFVAMTGEFVGTFLFLFFALGGTQVANNLPPTSSTEPILYISLVFGFSLLVNVWVFYRISGGLFNPAVSPLPSLSAPSPCFWLIISKGNSRHVYHGLPPLVPRPLPPPRSDSRRHLRACNRLRPPTRAPHR